MRTVNTPNTRQNEKTLRTQFRRIEIVKQHAIVENSRFDDERHLVYTLLLNVSSKTSPTNRRVDLPGHSIRYMIYFIYPSKSPRKRVHDDVRLPIT